MAHQVLARKYRPQRFADVAGQQHVTVTLMNALSQGRIAHGYIFSGHRGIGKTTVARILAMALNCRHSIGSDLRLTAEPCERCESCVEIRAGNAVDVIEIDAATNRGIDEIRELRDAARYRPARDKYKIYILDEAHQITDAAFNALLKTLEEPPDHIVFMMATTQPEDIPQTVRSRCQHFSFHAVKMADILGELRGIAEHESVAADETALSLLAEAGDGSMRDALSIMDQAIASAPMEDGRSRLDAAQIRELMGSVSNAVLERMLDAVHEGRSAEVITVANDLLDAGNSSSQLARQCVRYLRNCLMAKISGLTPEGVGSDGNGGALLQTSPDEQRRASRTAAKFSEEELTRFLQVMLRTFDELGYRQEQRFRFELGLLKLVHLRRLLPLEELLSRLPGGAAPQWNLQPPSPRTAAPVKAVFNSAGSGPVATQTGSDGASVEVKTSFSPFQQDAARRDLLLVSAALSPRGSDTASEAPMEEEGRLIGTSVAQEAGTPSVDADRLPSKAPSSSTSGPSGDTLDSPRPAEGEQARSSHLERDAALAKSAQDLRETAGRALAATHSQDAAAGAIEEAEWVIGNGSIRIQTSLSPTMLPMMVNAEAEKIVRAALREAGAGGMTIEILPGKPRATDEAKRPQRERSGSAQAKAEQHPIVQQAQRLFHAEIRKVIDLTEGK